MGKLKANLRAVELLLALETDARLPTAEERKVLAQYTGFGHSPQVFDEIKADDWKAHLEGQYSIGYSRDPDGLENWAARFFEYHQTLKQILAPEEWSRAEASVLNAHYTSREVVEHGLWAAARHLRFDGGHVLENSAGIGHVLGLAPDDVAENSRLTACELDSITGQMLRMLYPQATVHVMGFQDAKIPLHSQDLVIGNFPFSKLGWSSDKYPFSLHNQFFARSLDLIVPGGLIIAITSDSTMDSPASAANAYQRLDTKQRFIQSIMSGANADREAEDVGAEAITSFADAFAAISGNPLVRERFDLETRIRNLERLQLQFEEDQCQARENLRRSQAEEASATKTAALLREQAGVLQPIFADSDRLKVVNGDTTAEGREQACELLEVFVSNALLEVYSRLKTQLRLDRQLSDVRERRISVPLHALSVNGVTINADAQVQYRPPEPPWSERISEPEIRYSFRIPGTDIWKSGIVTTGRGFLDSVRRKIAELEEDARYRENVAQAKRRQIEELTGLQARAFTHAQELAESRVRLDVVKADLERSTNPPRQEAPDDRGMEQAIECRSLILST